MANSMKESTVREIIIIISMVRHMVRGVHLTVRNQNLPGLRI